MIPYLNSLRGELARVDLSEVDLSGANLNDGCMAQNQATVAIENMLTHFLTERLSKTQSCNRGCHAEGSSRRRSTQARLPCQRVRDFGSQGCRFEPCRVQL